MRISDWSSDVCSSDLSKQKALHQSVAKLDRQRAQVQQRAMKRLEDRARASERQFRPPAASPSSPTFAASGTALERELTHDVFICHASEDKDLVARPLAELLRGHGVTVWYDEFSLTVGDSLRRKIDRGLSDSRFGVVLLSPDFFRKEWPQAELDGLVARERSEERRVGQECVRTCRFR